MSKKSSSIVFSNSLRKTGEDFLDINILRRGFFLDDKNIEVSDFFFLLAVFLKVVCSKYMFKHKAGPDSFTSNQHAIKFDIREIEGTELRSV